MTFARFVNFDHVVPESVQHKHIFAYPVGNKTNKNKKQSSPNMEVKLKHPKSNGISKCFHSAFRICSTKFC